MIETRVFDDLNDLDSEDHGPGLLPPDLDPDNEPQPEPPGCMPFLLGKLRCEFKASLVYRFRYVLSKARAKKVALYVCVFC